MLRCIHASRIIAFPKGALSFITFALANSRRECVRQQIYFEIIYNYFHFHSLFVFSKFQANFILRFISFSRI